MEYARVFKQPHLVGLWLSQVLSSVGDQLYSIAIIWIAVKQGGGAAGFVAAAGSIAGLGLGLIGGVYADRWNRRTTMIVVDLLRAFVVIALAVTAHFMPLNLWHLGMATVLVSGLGALFDPALAASLPELTGNHEGSLQAMNAMMQVNHRIARTVGPALSGAIVAMTSLHHFFTIDAITFLVSAVAVFSIGNKYRWKIEQAPANPGIKGVWQDIGRGASLVRQHEQMFWAFLIYVGANIAWNIGFLVGFPLWVRHLPGADVGTYGILVAAYGVGSVSSNVVMGTILSRKRMLFISVSQLIFGLGFLTVSCANNLPLACFGSMLAAAGGPIGDVMLMIMLQTDIPRKDLGKVYSLRQCVMYLGGALGLLLAPPLYQIVSPAMGIAICGITFGLLGIIGLLRFGTVESSHRPYEGHAEEQKEIMETGTK